MRKVPRLLAALVATGAFLFFNVAYADSIFSSCDVVSSTVTAYSGSFSCIPGGSTDSARDLFGASVNVFSTSGTTPLYVKIFSTNAVAYTSACISISPILLTGPQYISFGTLTIPAGANVNAAFYSDSGCTAGGTGLAFYGPSTPVGYASVSWSWSPNAPINFQAISFPFVYSTTSQALAASFSLWQSIEFASSTPQCASTGLIEHALCSTMTFLFVPSPDILNGYVNLFSTSSPSSVFARFPGSYIAGISTAFSTLSASSSGNIPLVAFDFASVDPATSTSFGPLLPDVTVLSTTTISHYFSPTIWNALQALISFGLWLALATDIFFYVRNHMHRV